MNNVCSCTTLRLSTMCPTVWPCGTKRIKTGESKTLIIKLSHLHNSTMKLKLLNLYLNCLFSSPSLHSPFTHRERSTALLAPLSPLRPRWSGYRSHRVCANFGICRTSLQSWPRRLGNDNNITIAFRSWSRSKSVIDRPFGLRNTVASHFS